jgi:hypothetical protein
MKASVVAASAGIGAHNSLAADNYFSYRNEYCCRQNIDGGYSAMRIYRLGRTFRRFRATAVQFPHQYKEQTFSFRSGDRFASVVLHGNRYAQPDDIYNR